MAIRQRKGRKKPWEVYWNTPFTLKRESLYVETEEEAKKQDALKKYQLKFERDMFRREEIPPLKIEHSFESAYYLFLKERRFPENALKDHLKKMQPSLAFFQNMLLNEIDNAKLKELVFHFLSMNVSASSLKRYLSQVFSVIRWAYENEVLKELPRFPKLPHIEHEHFVPPTQQELAQIYAHAPEHIRRVIVLGSQMGMRVGPSEMFGLKWSDVDFDNKVIHLRAAKKNKRAPVRDIHLIHYGNKPVHSIRKAWGKILIRAGIQRRIRPYDLRHAFATEAIAAGADIGTVAKIMGHTSLTMVLKHYQHVLDSQKRAAAESVPVPVYVAENMWHSVARKTVSQ